MKTSHRILWILMGGMPAAAACAAQGQSYPSRPVRMIAAEAGGTNDQVARLIAPALSAGLGQQTIVDNRGSIIMPQLVARAQPDGHTIMLAGSGIWLAEHLRSDVPYRMSEFAPVSWVTSSPGILVVHPSVAASSVKELIALAKAKPGALNYSSGTPGNLTHLAPELFKLMTGVNMVGIPYKGGGPALAAVVSGQVQLMFATAGGVSPQIRSGRLKALAVTSAQPSALFPELPTIAATGLPGYEAVAMNGILAPVKTPAAILRQLSEEFARIAGRADIRERMLNNGVEAVGSTPAEFAAKIKADTERMGRIIKATGIRAE